MTGRWSFASTRQYQASRRRHNVGQRRASWNSEVIIMVRDGLSREPRANSVDGIKQ
jgi:hypothetical protein